MKAIYSKSIRIVLLIFPLVMMHNGCIMFTSCEYKPQHGVAKSGLEKRKIHYQFKRTSRSSGVGFDRDNCSEVIRGSVALAQDKEVALKQFQDEFSDVTISACECDNGADTNRYDILMNIHLQNSWDKNILPFAGISGATFTIIPCWGKEAYTLYVEVKDVTRGIDRTYELTSYAHKILWFPFVIACPFNEIPEVYIDKITKDNWHELKMRMCADGFFESGNLQTK